MEQSQLRLLLLTAVVSTASFCTPAWAINDNNAMVINTIRAIPATVCTAQSKISSCMKMNGSVEVTAGTGVPSTYSIDELAYLRDSTAVNGITPSNFTGNGIPSAGTAVNSGSLMCYVLDVDAGAAGVYNFSCEMNGLSCNKLYRYHFAGSHTTAGNAEHSNTNSTNTSLYAYSTACAPVSGTNGSLNQTSADVSLNVNKGALPQTMSLEWGATTAYGNAGVITSSAVVAAANSGTANVTASMTGLSCETSYHYRFNSTTDDSAVNGSVTVNGSDQVFTTASCDTTPPVLSDILQLTGGITDFSYTLTSNEAGNLYYVVLPSGSTAPDATQVQAGQDSTNTPVTAAGQKTLSAASAVTVATSGLTAETLYSLYVVAKDTGGNLTGVTSYPIVFTPSAPTAVVATSSGSQANIAFTAPSFTGGGAITSYTATSTPSGLTATSSASPISVPGLASGVSYTFSVKATNAMGASVASTSSNAITPNNAPIALNSSVTLEEDSAIGIVFTGQDSDGDLLSFQVVTPPVSGSLEKNGLVWLYTPNANFNGADSVTFIANDGSLSSNAGTVSITVTPVNDAPKAVDDNYNLTKTATNSYSLPVLENDSDVDGDNLMLEGAAADVGLVTIASGVLTYQASTDYVGPVSLRYSVSDGQKARSTAKVNLLIAGENTENLPIITVPTDLDVNATGLFTKVKLGVATAVDNLGNKLAVSLVNSQQLFAPGNHLAYWQATDAQGRTAIKAQKVRVKPLISISRDQVVAEGSKVKVSVYLNGESPEYPVVVPFSVSGSADSDDHDLVAGEVVLASGLSTSFTVNLYDDSMTEEDEDLVINLDPSVNLSSQSQTRLLISETNIAPEASIEVRQANELRTQISKLAGKVYIRAKVSDANSQDNLSQAWSVGALVLQTDVDGTFFEPDTLDVGVYPLSVTVSDDGAPSLSTKASLNIKITESLAVLTGEDSDGDLIPDDQEGFSDGDGDGIADYLDAITQCNVLQERGLEQVFFLAESPSGVCLSLGKAALADTSNGIGLSDGALPSDADTANIGGVFDFIATELPKQGDSYSFSLPQALPVPINAVYRKFNVQTGWRDFVIDDKNSIASTIGEPGLCPPPGSNLWKSGLNEGHWCVQLTIQDGGPNDDDGIANGTIVDPGGVAIVLNGNHLPTAVDDSFKVPINESRDIDVLANDTDSDGDTLIVTQVISQFGTAVVLDNQQVSYTAATDFIGNDVLVYSISDGKGGTASGKLTVTVSAYIPQTIDNQSGGGSLSFAWLSLLLLAVVRRVKSQLTLVVMGLLGLTALAPVQAAEQDSPWYLDASLGLSETDQAKSELQQTVTSGTISDYDNSDTLMGLSVGYQLNPMIAFELGYLDQGDGSAQITGGTLNPSEYHQQLKAISPILAQGVTLGAKFTLIEHEGWRFDIPVGLFFWESEVNSYSQGQSLTTKLDGTDWYAGMHFGYQFHPSWEAGVGIKYIALDSNDVLSYQVNLIYHF